VVGLEPDVAVGDDADQDLCRYPVTGTPEIPEAGRTGCPRPRSWLSGPQVTGLVIMPALGPLDHVHLLRLLLHGQICGAARRRPPWRAMAIAIRRPRSRLSIDAETSGTRSR